MLPNTCNNNPSLSAAKTSTFSGRTFTSHNCPEGLHCSPFAALLLSTEPIWKMFFPISHLDTNTWENRVQVWKIPMLPFKRGNGEKCLSCCSKGISLINHRCLQKPAAWWGFGGPCFICIHKDSNPARRWGAQFLGCPISLIPFVWYYLPCHKSSAYSCNRVVKKWVLNTEWVSILALLGFPVT